MSCFKTRITTTTATSLDPTKHVNFQLGMVLGEDDFKQEFAYLSGRDQWLVRDLLGYGTARGLRVGKDTHEGKQRVVVQPGVAVSPSGQLICVPAEQCCTLDDWLAAKLTEVNNHLSSPPSNTLTLYVVLCYRECKNDNVPIPGEPCRSEDELTAPSRIADDFQLELRFTLPLQREEDAVRDFIEWLRFVEVKDTFVSVPIEQFLQAIRDAASPWLSPPGSPPSDFMFGSPPTWIQIHPSDLCRYLRAAFRLWVTELRPHWIGRGQGCAPDLRGEQPDEDCVMLAELTVPVLPNSPSGWVVDSTRQVEIKEERRPYLVHLRMLQEWLLCGKHGSFTAELPSLAGDVTGEIANSTVVGLQGNALAAIPPNAGQVLTFDGAQWTPDNLPPALAAGLNVTPEQNFGLGSNAGAAVEYSRADHTHGTPPDPIPPHQADAGAHNLAGDLRGTVGVATVIGLMNTPIIPLPAAPADGQVLTFRAGQWRYEAAPGGNPNAVEHLPGLPQYLIVAAGRIRCDDLAPNPFPVYNNLKLRLVRDGLVSLIFGGYQQPDNTFQYVVKALPEVNPDLLGNSPGLTVYFANFQTDANGFNLLIRDNNGPVRLDRLRSLVLHIEISQYFD